MELTRRMRILISISLVVLALIAGALLVGWAFTFQVRESEFAVQTRFGRPVTATNASGKETTILGPGLHFRIPLVDRAYIFDHRIRYMEIRPMMLSTRQSRARVAAALPEDAAATPPDDAAHQEANVLVFHAYACWRVVDPLQFLKSLRGDYEAATLYLEKLIASKMGAVVGRSTMKDFVSLRREDIRTDEIEEEIASSVSDGAREKFGVEVLRVGFQRITLAGENLDSVKRRMREERDTIAQRFRNQADSIYRRIVADANKEKDIIIANADKEAKEIVARSNAEAAEILARTAERDPDFYRFYRSLQTLEQILSARSSVVLSTDAEPFSLLKSSKPRKEERARSEGDGQ